MRPPLDSLERLGASPGHMKEKGGTGALLQNKICQGCPPCAKQCLLLQRICAAAACSAALSHADHDCFDEHDGTANERPRSSEPDRALPEVRRKHKYYSRGCIVGKQRSVVARVVQSDAVGASRLRLSALRAGRASGFRIEGNKTDRFTPVPEGNKAMLASVQTMYK